jgi:hypothetical protein
VGCCRSQARYSWAVQALFSTGCALILAKLTWLIVQRPVRQGDHDLGGFRAKGGVSRSRCRKPSSGWSRPGASPCRRGTRRSSSPCRWRTREARFQAGMRIERARMRIEPSPRRERPARSAIARPPFSARGRGVHHGATSSFRSRAPGRVRRVRRGNEAHGDAMLSLRRARSRASSRSRSIGRTNRP